MFPEFIVFFFKYFSYCFSSFYVIFNLFTFFVNLFLCPCVPAFFLKRNSWQTIYMRPCSTVHINIKKTILRIHETLRQSFSILKLLMFFAKTFAEARKGQVVFVLSICGVWFTYRGRIQRKTWCMGPYAGVDYTSPYVHSRVDSNTFTLGNPMPEST